MEADNIEDRILAYSQLPPDEQVEVEQYVRENTEYEPLLAEARSLAALVAAAGRLEEHPPGGDVIAYYASLRYLPERPPPSWLHEPLQRLDRVVEESPALQSQVEEHLARLAELDRSGDAVAQFERLTGRSLPDSEVHVAKTAPARPPQRPLRLPSQGWLRWAVAAVFLFVAAYGILFLVSRSTESELDRLAAFTAEDLEVGGYTVTLRGGDAEAPARSSDALFLQSLDQIQDARSSFLGLFTRYDAAALGEAETNLRQVISDPYAGAFLHLEALYLVGKIRLLSADVSGAQDALRQVVAGQGRMADQASNILTELDENSGSNP